MSQIKLFAVLDSLDNQEWRSLKKYASMFLDPDSNGLKLIDKLFHDKKNKTSFSPVDQLKRNFFEHMSQKAFANLCSRMFLLVEQWISYAQMSKDEFLSDLLRNKFYNRRGLFKFADKTAKQLQTKLDQNQSWDLEKNKAQYQLIHQQYFSDNPIKYQQGGVILGSLVLNYSLALKCQSLFYMCELHNWGRVQSYSFAPEIEYLTKASRSLPDSDISKALKKLTNLIAENDPADLSDLVNFLYTNKIKKGSDLHVIFCLYLISMALKFWQSGQLKDLSELSRLYNYALETGVLLADGKIPLVRFFYISAVISLTSSYDYANGFIGRWYVKSQTKDLESVRLVAIAQNCAYNDKEEEIMHYLRSVKFTDEAMKMRVGVLTLISLYKTRKEDLFFLKIQLKNFKAQLKRIKGKSFLRYKEGVLNFIKVLDLLIKNDRNPTELDLSQYKNLIFRAWLIKQIESI